MSVEWNVTSGLPGCSRIRIAVYHGLKTRSLRTFVREASALTKLHHVPDISIRGGNHTSVVDFRGDRGGVGTNGDTERVAALECVSNTCVVGGRGDEARLARDDVASGGLTVDCVDVGERGAVFACSSTRHTEGRGCKATAACRGRKKADYQVKGRESLTRFLVRHRSDALPSVPTSHAAHLLVSGARRLGIDLPLRNASVSATPLRNGDSRAAAVREVAALAVAFGHGRSALAR